MRFQQLNPQSCKTYLLGEEESLEVIIIDPVLDHFNDYLQYLNKNNLKLVRVMDTHTHADHISGGAALRDVTGCDYMMHEKSSALCAATKVGDGHEFWLGRISISVIHAPGHTEDSMSLIFGDRLFTGDALFLDEGGAGRDDLPGGDPAKHWETLEKFKKLPEKLVVHPAHEYRDKKPSSLATQKKTNPHLKNRTKEEFVQYIEDLRLGPADWMRDVLKANYACARDPRAAWVPVDGAACEIRGTMEHGVNDIVVEEISSQDLKKMLDSGNKPLLLDVRQPKELEGELGRLDGIMLVPIGEITSKLATLDIYKNTEIITVCRSGSRAHTAGQILKQAGFGNVRVLGGGMRAWREEFGAENK